MSDERPPFPLFGLDGANLLGFLAALGTLRTAALAHPESSVRMSWRLTPAGWRPVLQGLAVESGAALARLLAGRLAAAGGHPAFALAEDLNVAPALFRSYALGAAAAATPADRSRADFCAAFGCEVPAEDDGATIRDTALRTMSGAGHQHFLGFMRQVIATTGEDHLARTLFATWRYDDPLEKSTLRWDPGDDQRYALRWRNPSGDPQRRKTGSMLGANRLAIEALPLLPTMPGARDLETTGFRWSRKEGTTFTWPLWVSPAPLDVVRSLLALAELREESPPRRTLRARGVAEVLRVRRITVGKFRSFTPAEAVGDQLAGEGDGAG